MECPLSLNNILYNPFYAYYSNSLWQKNSYCFFLKTNVFYKSTTQQVKNYLEYFFKNIIIIFKKYRHAAMINFLVH